jgi:hypothetical protein
MASSRPFAFNSGATVSGTEQIGQIAVGVTFSLNQPSGLNWFNGPDEDLGYIICKTSSQRTWGNNTGLTGDNSISFYRSNTKTENSFVDLVNSIFGKTMSTGNSAKTFLNDNGLWTSWQESSTLVQYFMVAGGGGSGVSGGGGGGAGGLIVGSTSIIQTETLTVTVGAGGGTWTSGNNTSIQSSSINRIAYGGGKGSNVDNPYSPWEAALGATGGCGGGGASHHLRTPYSAPTPGFAGVSGQGNSGGSGTGYLGSFNRAGGGGGGYSSAGTNAGSYQGGNGGNGYLLSWNNTGYAGGGAGGALRTYGGVAGSVQSGYGGGGAQNSSRNGRANSGGGGGLYLVTNSDDYAYGLGGSGIVIIRSSKQAISTTGAPIVTSGVGYTQYVFNGSGTITF